MTSSKIIEVMARAICRASCGPRMQRDEPERVECQVENGWDMWTDEAQAAFAAYESHLQASGMAVVPRAEIEEARARFAEIRLLLPDGRACALAGAGAWDLNHILTAPKDGKSDRPEASAEAQSAVAHSPNAPDREGERDE